MCRPTPLYGQPSWWGEEDYGSQAHSNNEHHAGASPTAFSSLSSPVLLQYEYEWGQSSRGHQGNPDPVQAECSWAERRLTLTDGGVSALFSSQMCRKTRPVWAQTVPSRRTSSCRTSENQVTLKSPPKTFSSPKPQSQRSTKSPPRTRTRLLRVPSLPLPRHLWSRATPLSLSNLTMACPEKSRSKTMSPNSPPARGSSTVFLPRRWWPRPLT